MSDIVAFIRARYDEHEAAAREAQSANFGSGRWRWNHGAGAMCNDPECSYGELVAEGGEYDAVLMNVHGYDVEDSWRGAAHIALNNPAYVLADIAAKRKIVAEHDPGRYYRRERERTPHCPVCLSDREGRYPEDWDADAAPCRTLRLLAAPFRAHPDFNLAWAAE